MERLSRFGIARHRLGRMLTVELDFAAGALTAVDRTIADRAAKRAVMPKSVSGETLALERPLNYDRTMGAEIDEGVQDCT